MQTNAIAVEPLFSMILIGWIVDRYVYSNIETFQLKGAPQTNRLVWLNNYCLENDYELIHTNDERNKTFQAIIDNT